MRRSLSVPAGLCFALLLPAIATAQEPIALKEAIGPGTMYRVSTRVQLSGSLTLPPSKDQPDGAKKLQIVGKSAIDYDERALQVDKQDAVTRSIRVYQRLEFERKVGEEQQKVSLRPEARRMVILRHKQMEVPFSPDGPLTWGEIDLVRTDVFTPALRGLLPSGKVAPGDRWSAATSAVLELTDFSELNQGSLACKFEKVILLQGQRYAHISFEGTVQGLTEDGASKQQLEGYVYFHLTGRYLSYLSMKGTQFMLDQDGKTVGKLEGTFVLTREPLQSAKELGDADLAKLTLEPNKSNTMLLHDDAVLGLRFLYPRRWHVAGAKGQQLGIDEKGGSGILLTVEPIKQLPTGAQFLQESQHWWKTQKGDILGIGPVKALRQAPTLIEHFTLDVQANKQKFRMYYLVVRDAQAGVVVAARLQYADLANLQEEVQQIVTSLQLTRKQ